MEILSKTKIIRVLHIPLKVLGSMLAADNSDRIIVEVVA
jgi:hypothetical protein